SAFPHLGATDPYVSLLVAGSSSVPVAAARTRTGGEFESVAKIRIVGDRLQLMIGQGESEALNGDVSASFDRQVRVFGGLGQQGLAQMHVAVVGVGGTGSAVTEQLS